MNNEDTIVRTIKAAFVCLLLSVNLSPAAEVISRDSDPLRWTITTAHSGCQVILGADSVLAAGWFGAPLDRGELLFADGATAVRRSELGTTIREVPFHGGYQHMEPALEVVFDDGVRELELVYAGYETGQLDGCPFIRFDMRDASYPLEVSEFIRIVPELDIYEKWLTLENTGKKNILIKRAESGSAVLPPGQYELTQLSGAWSREFIPRTSLLTQGNKVLSINALSSIPGAPFFMLRPKGDRDEFHGPVWFGEVAWTGNWRIDCNVNQDELTQVMGGINWWNTHWNLLPGTKFETPKIILGYSGEGPSGASRSLHRYIVDHVLPPEAAREPARVIYCNWSATGFNITCDRGIALARVAAEVGAEIFLLDDGWFKGRNNSHAGLGDWVPDPVKFPNGLKPLVDEVNRLGMDFGIWVEPEMVNPNSDLYRAHPDWALHTPNRTQHTGRNQLMLNLAREDVKQYLLEALDKLITENNVRLLKWDMNRRVSEADWPEAPVETRPEMFIRYTRNMVEILSTLRDRHPGVVFETCAAGGGRVNPQILSLESQAVISDNSDSGDRLHIQYGFSYAFPARSMYNCVTNDDLHDKKTTLQYKFHVAMAGNLGLGCDLNRWNREEVDLAKEMLVKYKVLRRTIQLGDQYRLWNPFEADRMAVQFVARDSSESVVFAYQVLETVKMASPSWSGPQRLALHGLDPAALYRVDYGDRTEERTGRVLMERGIVPALKGNYSSRMIVLNKI